MSDAEFAEIGGGPAGKPGCIEFCPARLDAEARKALLKQRLVDIACRAERRKGGKIDWELAAMTSTENEWLVPGYDGRSMSQQRDLYDGLAAMNEANDQEAKSDAQYGIRQLDYQTEERRKYCNGMRRQFGLFGRPVCGSAIQCDGLANIASKEK